MDMPSPRSIARASWGDAQKLRLNLQSQAASLKKERANANYTALFEAIERTLAQLRLACMQVIFHEFEYATDKKVEHTLWQAHTSVNGEYRKVVGRLGGQSQVVQKRKVERMYREFLKTSQSFYCGYIQRLAGRFYIPELRQAAQGLNMLPVDMSSRDESPPSPLRKLVTASCQTSLVHLGDLARYRCQLSDRSTKASFDTALAYYGLANSVDPDNGSAHHQMAVLYQIQGQHFEIVYHFHRAIAVAKPYELAIGNLEREYRGLQNPASAQAKDPADAMVSWFVRLHGFYFHGEPFTQQGELETEVLHRLERALIHDGNDSRLLRMALINIASYDIATRKVKDDWTLHASRTCQFLLRWTVRSIALLLRLTKAELQDEGVASGASRRSGSSDESPLVFSPALSKLLIFYRIYIAWIFTVRSDIVEYREFLEPHIGEVFRLLADSLTLLNTYVGQCSGTVQSKYLLFEDIEAVGLRPLSDRKLPLFLSVEEISDAQPSRRYKMRKPRREVVGVSYQAETETVWRIRDIIYCGIFLAGSAHFPVSIITVKCPDGQDLEGWVFTDEHSTESYMDEAGMSRLLERLEVSNLKDVADHRDEQTNSVDLVTVDVAATQSKSSPRQKARKVARVPTEPTRAVAEPSLVAQSHYRRAPASAAESDINQDNAMLDMVNKLLDPPDEIVSNQVNSFTDSSYGMNSSTVNEVFGQLEHGSGQPSPLSKAIPNLPWGYFYTPNWNNLHSQNQGPMIPDAQYGSRTAAGGREYVDHKLDGLPADHRGNEGGYSGAYLGGGHTSVSAATSPHRSASTSQNNSLLQPGARSANDNARNAVLESLAQALYAQHGLSPSTPEPPPGAGFRRTGSGSVNFQQTNSGNPSSPRVGDKVSKPYSRHGPVDQFQSFATPGQQVLGLSPRLSGSAHPSHASGLGRGHSSDMSGFHPHSSGEGIYPPQQGMQRIGLLSGDVPRRSTPQLGLGDIIDQHGLQQSSPWNHDSGGMNGSMSFSHPSSLFAGTPNAFIVPRTDPNASFGQGSSPLSQPGLAENHRQDGSAVTESPGLAEHQVLPSTIPEDGQKQHRK